MATHASDTRRRSFLVTARSLPSLKPAFGQSVSCATPPKSMLEKRRGLIFNASSVSLTSAPPKEPLPALPQKSPCRKLRRPPVCRPSDSNKGDARDPMPSRSLKSGPSPSELRLPAVDPRRGRRRCTDFGLSPTQEGESPPLPPPPPARRSALYRQSFLEAEDDSMSSTASSPLDTCDGSLSNSSYSSLLQDADFDFPEPPPISPILRHMKSTPLFALDETSFDRNVSANRRCTMDFPHSAGRYAKPTPVAYVHDDDPRIMQNDVSLLSMSSLGETLERQGEALLQMDVHRRQPWLRSQADIRSAAPRPAPPLPRTQNRNSFHPIDFPASPPTLPQSTSHPPFYPRRLTKMRSLKFIYNNEDRPVTSSGAEKEERRKILRGRSTSMEFHTPTKKKFHVWKPSIDRGNRKSTVKPELRQDIRFRVPDPIFREDSEPRRSSFSAPFFHPAGQARVAPSQHNPNSNTTSAFRSFMDMTPEKAQASNRPADNSKPKLSKLLRAGLGLKRLSKQFTRKRDAGIF